MRNYRFYEELDHKGRKGETSRGTVVAVDTANGVYFSWDGVHHIAMREAWAALTDRPNAPVCGTGVSIAYLRDTCRRIREDKARVVHPALFAWLESIED